MRRNIAIAVLAIVAASSMAWAQFPSLDDIGKAIEKTVQEGGKAVEKGAQDLGKAVGVEVPQKSIEPVRQLGENSNREVKKGIDDTWRELAKGTGNLSNESGKALDGVNQFFSEVSKGFCSIMTGGGSDNGKASCHVNAGASVNDKGEIKGWNPETGEDYKAERKAAQDFLKEGQTLDSIAQALFESGQTLAIYSELEASDWDSTARFLGGEQRVGNPLPEGGLFTITKSGEIRGKDKEGSGSFLSLRKYADKPTRFHGGVDYVTKPGDPIVSPISGLVRVITSVYEKPKNGVTLTGIEIVGATHTAKVLYVTPATGIQTGTRVEGGKPLGTAQDIQASYGKKMTNHVHETITDREGRIVNPSGRLVIKKVKK